MMRAGHADLQTAQIYLREAENLRQGFGRVSHPLPVDLRLRPAIRPIEDRILVSRACLAAKIAADSESYPGWSRRGSNSQSGE